MAPTNNKARFAFAFWALTLTFFIILKIDESDEAKATEHMYLDHVICKYAPEYTANCSCKLNFMTRLRKSYTSYCEITKPMDKIRTHAQLFYKYRNGYQAFLVDIYMNACDFLSKKATSKVMDMVWPKIKTHLHTSQNLTCPFTGRFDLVGLPTDGDFFNNIFLPVGDYMCNVTVMNNDEFVWNGRYYATIPAGKTIEDDRMGR